MQIQDAATAAGEMSAASTMEEEEEEEEAGGHRCGQEMFAFLILPHVLLPEPLLPSTSPGMSTSVVWFYSCYPDDLTALTALTFPPERQRFFTLKCSDHF